MLRVIILVAGIVAAALDHRLGWVTVVSVAIGLYCHRLYRPPVSGVPAKVATEEDDLGPGWAARWDYSGVRHRNGGRVSFPGVSVGRDGNARPR
jgi:hypothetical protein